MAMTTDIAFNNLNRGLQIGVNSGIVNAQFNIHADPLDKLPIANGVEFDYYTNQHEDECLNGTRTELLQQITKWTLSPSQKGIFWLKGMAGTGKSTISRTVARSLKDTNHLGASFFFKRGEGDRGNAKKFFPTLVRQLMLRIPLLRPSVDNALHDDPNITSKSLREQFEKLLLQPLLTLDQLGQQPQTAVIVIDALDECEHNQDVRNIIRLLPLLQRAKAARLRIFLTSRPEPPISLGFSDIAHHEYQDLSLHEIPDEVTERDIHLFLQDRFAKIKRDRNISHDWPGDEVIQQLVRMSVPLFISAATVCRYIENSKWEPKLRLAELLVDQAKYVSRMDKTYLPVLKRLLDDQESDESEQQQLLHEFQHIVGVIILLTVPLSINALSVFLGIGADQISNRLDSFRSVLSIPGDRDQPVRILHLSFRDFLVRSGTKFHVDEPKKHKDIAQFCLKIMQSHLRKNICNLASTGTCRADIDPQHIRQCLPPELQYSCHYWIHHLEQSQTLPFDIEDILPFLQRHFLHWVEAMSLLGIISEVVGMLGVLSTFIPGNEIISQFLYDGTRFVMKNSQIADQAPLQIYCAGLVFAPQTAIIRTEFKSELPNWILQLPQVKENWGAEVQTLDGHPDWVQSVAFAPNGRLLASGSSNTVRLWDPATGALQQTLKGSSGQVNSVAFSPDGQLLACGSDDNIVRLWDPATGGLQQTLEGHLDDVNSVAFSPDGQLLASGSLDNTVRLWDPATGALQKTLESNSGKVWSMAFSPDGRLLAAGSSNTTVWVWDLATGAIQQTLGGYWGWVTSVAFSPDGRLLASSSDSAIVELWDLATGGLQQTLTGHSNEVRSVVFSPDGRLLASGSLDNTVRLWDPATGALQKTLKGHSGSVKSVAFSPDGRLLASGSHDKTVRFWDPATSDLAQTLEGHSSSVFSMAFSPGGRLLASGSHDKTVRFWDPATGVLQKTLEGHSGSVGLLAFSPNGRLLASADFYTVRLWDPATGALQQALEFYSGWVTSVAFSPDCRLLASGSKDNIVRLWDPATGGLTHTLEGHSDDVNSVAFSHDGRLLASGSHDKTVRLWDPATGALQKTLEGHSSWVTSVAFSPDGRLLASSSDTGIVRLWDPATGGLTQTLETERFVKKLEFSEDGSYLITNRGIPYVPSAHVNHASNSACSNMAIFIEQGQWINLNVAIHLSWDTTQGGFHSYDFVYSRRQ